MFSIIDVSLNSKMYIKSVVIDGFKTYGNRVEAPNFDPQFTAITGPNGSGKSNFLDAITFVLGMQSARLMRGDSFQDLIFKQGQAGVSKASVTIVFDNSDQSKSPPYFRGLHEFAITRQILSTGGIKCTYLINSKLVQNKQVADIFNSVHLNVNNPHFLVMQGQIARILNNNPTQNVAMIEEAVGTSVYRAKRETHDKILTKKVSKLDDIDKVLNEDIAPLIEKIRTERNQYNEFLKLKDEFAKAEKRHLAYSYNQTEKAKQKWTENLRNTIQKAGNIRVEVESIQDQINKHNMLIANINEEVDAQTGSQLQKIRNELRSAEDDLSDTSRALDRVKEKQSQEKVNLSGKLKYLESCESSYKDDEKSLKKVEQKHKTLTAEKSKLSHDLELAQEAYSKARSGQYVVSQPGAEDNKTLQEQLLERQTKVYDIDRIKIELGKQSVELPKTLKRKQEEMKAMDAKLLEDKKECECLDSSIKYIKDKVDHLNFSKDELQSLKQEKMSIDEEYKRLYISLKGNKYDRVNFQYTTPKVRDFRSDYVYGVVATLFQSVDSQFNIGLDKAASGKLTWVLVEEESTSRTLVNHKAFDRRTTFLPLQQAKRNCVMDQRIVHAAKRMVGGDNVHLALDLVTFDDKYRPALELIFGNVLVCANIDIAMKLAYDPQIRKKCVTVDGDVVDPGGTQFGGARQTNYTIYELAEDYLRDKRRFAELDQKCKNTDQRIRQLSDLETKYTDLSHALDIQEYKRNQINLDAKMKAYADLKEEIENITRDIGNLGKRLKEQDKLKKEENEKIKEIEETIQSFSSNREQLIEEKMKQINSLKGKLRKIDDDLKSLDDCEFIRQRINELTAEIEETKSSIKSIQEALVEIETEVVELNTNRQLKKDVVDRLKREEKEELKNIAKRNDRIREYTSANEALTLKIGESNVKLEEATAEQEAIENRLEGYTKQLSEIEQKHGWIVNERSNFGGANGLYDFKGYTFESGESHLADMKEKIDEIKANTNMTLKNLHGNEETEFNSFSLQKQGLDRDLSNLRSTADLLDEHRIVALEEAWKIISDDFGKILSTALPGAFSKLVPLPGKSISDGLEIKVSLGGMWKKDLSELSGGQKSLTALSFILAMSRYNPAPIYILDEVDAALDLSHTENVGEMIKKHFKNTQFIIVSLKEGLFNNANRIFRTALRDGMSQITRAK